MYGALTTTFGTALEAFVRLMDGWAYRQLIECAHYMEAGLRQLNCTQDEEGIKPRHKRNKVDRIHHFSSNLSILLLTLA